MSGGFYDTVMLEEEHFRKIEKVLTIKLSDENKAKLQQACNAYIIDRDVPMPRLVNVKEQLDIIQKHSEILICAIKNVDDITASYLSMNHPNIIEGLSKLKQKEREIRQKYNTDLVKKMDDLLELLPDDLQVIGAAAAKAIKNIKPDKGGRPHDVALDMLVQRLQQIYEEVTEKKATTYWNEINNRSEGHFLKFCKTFLKIVGDNKAKAHSREAFAATVKRILKRRSTQK